MKEAELAAGAPASDAKDGAVDVVEVKGEGPGKAVEKLEPREAASCSAGAKRKRASGAALLSENGTEAADGAVKEAKAAPGCDAGKVEKLAAAGAPVSDAKDGAVEVVEVKGEGAVKAAGGAVRSTSERLRVGSVPLGNNKAGRFLSSSSSGCSSSRARFLSLLSLF